MLKSLTNIFLVLVFLMGWIMAREWLPMEYLECLIHKNRILGILFFLVTYIFSTLMMLPTTILNLIGGGSFGLIEGIILTTLGGLISSCITFCLSKVYKNQFIDFWNQHKLNPNGNHWTTEIENKGFYWVIALRFIPFLPYNIVSLMCGLSTIKPRDYFLGTLVGTPIGVAPFVYLGSTGSEELNVKNLVLVTCILLIILMMYIFSDQLKKQSNL